MRRIPILLMLIALAFTGVACKEQAKEKEAKEKKERKPLEELFPGDAPAVYPPAAGIEFGMTVDEAKAVNEGLAKGKFESIDLDDYGFRMGIDLKLTFPFDDSAPRIKGLQLLMYSKDLDEVVIPKWGEPKTFVARVPDPDGKLGDFKEQEVRVWYNPDKGLKAQATKAMMFDDMVDLELQPYRSTEQIVGTGKGSELAFFEGW